MRALTVIVGLLSMLLLSAYAPAQPPLPPQEQPKRPWGPEQALGAPDTPQPGDRPTAWASLRPDGGEEWLRVGFGKAVDIAEVRIRETFNPGAVSKVTALLDSGEEVLLWEGEDPTVEAPADFVVEIADEVTAKSVKMYIDSDRVPGWNEIDAVELVGKDGTRQWASFAAASSTYAHNTSFWQDQAPVTRGLVTVLNDEPIFAAALNKEVTVQLEGGTTLKGTLTNSSATRIVVHDQENRRTLIVNWSKVVYFEWND